MIAITNLKWLNIGTNPSIRVRTLTIQPGSSKENHDELCPRALSERTSRHGPRRACGTKPETSGTRIQRHARYGQPAARGHCLRPAGRGQPGDRYLDRGPSAG